MYSFGVATQYNKADTVNEFCRMSIAVGCMCDAVIYIFMSPPVKKLLIKKLSGTFCGKYWGKLRSGNRVGVAGRNREPSIAPTVSTIS